MKLIYVFFLAMTPVGEVRLSIPMGVFYYHISALYTYLVSVAGNIVIAVILVFILNWLELQLRRSPFMDRLYQRYIDGIRNKAGEKVKKWSYVALLLFVGVPLPGSGVYTGALVGYIFGMNRWKSIIYISLGAVMASTIVIYLTITTKTFMK